MTTKKARVIALYLPQFHPIPENDAWWGKGFTEWTNVAKAKPLFKGHYQPHIPADLGFYDLRLPEVREAQAELAREAGIEGFCYWHYWFGNGRRLLERPFNEVLESGKPDFPFCLAWANHSWSSNSWKKGFALQKNTLLLEQTYPGEQDYIDHFHAVLPALQDKRYICVDGKPLFAVFRPHDCPDMARFIAIWRDLAVKNRLPGTYFVGMVNNARNKTSMIPSVNNAAECYNSVLELGFDAVCSQGLMRADILANKMFLAHEVLSRIFKINHLITYDQDKINKNLLVEEDKWENVFPSIYSNWDRSPRAGKKAAIYVNSTPKVFEKLLRNAIELIKDKDDEHKILFLRSWNEWGEGNHVEPDLKYGKGYLEALRKCLLE